MSPVQKKKDRYFVYIHHTAPDGRRYQTWHGGFARKRDAERHEHEIQAGLGRGASIEPTKKTVQEFFEAEWRPHLLASSRAPGTKQQHEDLMLNHVLPTLGGARIWKLETRHLNDLYRHLEREGRVDGKGGLSAHTVHHVHVTIHKMLSDAVKWGVVPTNVAANADPPKPPVGRVAKTTWDPAQVRRFLLGIKDHRLYPAYVVAAMTGLRRSEVLGLRWGAVDLSAPQLTVVQSLIRARDGFVFKAPKTRRSRRSIPLDQETVRTLEQWRDVQSREKPSWTRDEGDAYDLVFTSPSGAPVSPDLFSETWRRLCDRSGLPAMRLHDLRHSFATNLLRAGHETRDA